MPNQSPDSPLAKGFEILRQFVVTILLHRTAFDFIKEHRPWRGIERLGWMLGAMAIAAALLSYQFFHEIYLTVQSLSADQQPLTASLSSFFSVEKLEWAMQGSRKYLVMVVLELVVFYFIQKTMEIRTGRKPELATQDFINAEMRMIKVSILAWVQERIVRFLIVELLFGIIGLDFLETPASFVIQCYFLGFALVDNYHECFGLKTSESQLRTRQTASGVAIGTGLIAFCLMYVPFVGAVAASMIGAVAATLAMERLAPVSVLEVEGIIAKRKHKKENKNTKSEPRTP